MNCENARLLIGADPRGAHGLEEHLQGCPACARFREEMLALDADIHRAMQRPPEIAHARVVRQSPAWRQWALAASVLLATVAVLGVWLLRPADTLARDLVTHIKAEPDSWLSARNIDAAGLTQELRGAGVALDLTSDKITYAQSCWFHGHYVPHLVLQTADGPATVLLLRHEQVPARRAFREAGMTGLIIPAQGGGGIAVLARTSGGVEPLARQMQQDLRWLPDAK